MLTLMVMLYASVSGECSDAKGVIMSLVMLEEE
jgi:hypothetical protein